MGKRLLLVMLFAVALWVPTMLRRAVWEPDEARYAYVAREMRADGHWFVPHRHAVFYAHKPPLMFWLINVGALFSGGEIGRFATRFPSLLGVMMLLWAIGGIAGMWLDRRSGWRAIFVTASTFAIWWRAGWGQIDMLLCGLQTMGLYWLFADELHRTIWRPFVAYCCFGLAVLAKGPVGFIVPVGAYIAANLAAGTGRNLLRLHWFWGVVVTLCWPGAWLGAAILSGAPAAYLDELLFAQNVERAAGGFGHIRPVYYYLQYLLTDGLPWMLVGPFAVWAMWRPGGDRRPAMRRALGWFGFVLLFFTALPTKRGLYILLAYPAMAIAVTAGWPALCGRTRVSRQIAVGLSLVVVLALGAATSALPRVPDVSVGMGVALCSAVCMLAGAVFLAIRWIRRGVDNALLHDIAAVFLGIYLVAGVALLPLFNARKTPVDLIPVVQRCVPAGQPLLLYQVHAEILPYYCDRPGRVYWDDAGLFDAINSQQDGIAIFLASAWEDKQHTFGHLGETGAFSMGHKEFVWLAF